jgi:uncharacterized protein
MRPYPPMTFEHYDRIRAEVLERYKLDPKGIHGVVHWATVEANGLLIADETEGVDRTVIRLFALIHDACRENDGRDEFHGAIAKQFALDYLDHRNFLPISTDQLKKLGHACLIHATGQLSDDPTIGACLDADRLDLLRVGIMPRPEFMSTQAGKALAQQMVAANRGDYE